MKLKNRDKKELVAGLLAELAPATTISKKQEKIEGFRLIQRGITKTDKGEQILPSTSYLTDVEIEAPINHERRIEKIIEDARTSEELIDNLAKYKVQFGKQFINRKK